MRLMHWCVIAASSTAGGALVGWVIGMFLARLSGDYVVMPSDYTNLGLRAGLVAGTILAACHGVTRTPFLGLNDILRSFAILAIVSIGVVGIAAICGLLLSIDQIAMPEDTNLAHPRRYMLFMAIHHSWVYSVFLASIVSGFFIWRRRKNA